jgi:DNA-binding transcriptional LysR family regulator
MGPLYLSCDLASASVSRRAGQVIPFPIPDLLDSAGRGYKLYFAMTEDLNVMAVFAAVAEAGGFTAAALRLGVSSSAVSQSIRKLEDGLGVVLVQRTTRSVRLTAAGERLYAGVAPALELVRTAVGELSEIAQEPRGTVRLHVTTGAHDFLAGPLVTEFLTRHPHVRLAVDVSDEPVDIVARGYDAGIEIGEVIDQDMIIVPVSGDLELAIVGGPSYFAKHQAPRHPRDLVEHACINWHQGGDAPAYRWEFTEKGRDFSVAVDWRVLSNDTAFNLRLAREGAGIAVTYVDMVRDDLEHGRLVRVLASYCPPFPGCFLYYPQRRQASPALRALVEYLRATRTRAKRERAARSASVKPRGRK